MKILILDPFTPDLPQRVAQYGEVYYEDPSHLSSAEVIIIRGRTRVDKEWLQAAPNLKLLIRGGVGVENIDLDLCRKRGVIVRSTPYAAAIAVAELVFALMLAGSRHVIEAHNALKHGEWQRLQLRGSELYGKTLGLIGVGRIGTEVAKRAGVFGMHVLGVRRTGQSHDIVKLVDFDTLLSRSDYISVHVPLNHKTSEIINKNTLRKMRPTAMVINVARGGCVNEADLAQALNEGRIACAAIDVFATEPLVNSPLLSARNIILTPHLGSPTVEGMRRVESAVEELISSYRAGELEP
jgi:D-3-phosphoglycerate dehydrogenase